MTNIPNNFYRVSIKALILDETGKKFAVVLEDNGLWEIPGGGLDWEESPTDCITREIREEMGLTVTEVSSALLCSALLSYWQEHEGILVFKLSV